jgi:hypothetical protein
MRALRVAVLFCVTACATAGTGDSSIELLLGGKAAVNLKSSSAHMTLTSDTAWSLEKHGTVDTTNQTVTWTITATQGSTTSGILIVNGAMTVKNTGSGGATIGNIVVNLQTRSGNTWVTKSSDIADATNDDAATTAKVVSLASSEGKSSFTENAASGHLIFMDAATNSAFALVPQVTIAPGATKTLLFTATYDNNVLSLAPGTSTRVEMLLSFGNAVTNAASKPNIDINGNGVIDPDEARVRTVASRLGLTVPPQTPSNQTVTLSDVLADITTTGTVTFSQPTIVLGTTTGTVTVHYDGGTSGGTITNCAHLTSTTQVTHCGGHNFPTIPGLNLTACDTVTIGPHVCSPGLPGCGWDSGDVVTYAQDAWGNPATTAGGLLIAGMDLVYAAGVEVGIAGTAGFSMRFFDAIAVFAYLPAVGTPAALSADLIDPMSSSSGEFGGNVLALQLDVDFSDASLLGGTSGLAFGDLYVCELTTATALDGMTVRQVLALANTLLGGGTGPVSIDDMNTIVFALTQAFVGGDPSTFAQQHLFAGSCPL